MLSLLITALLIRYTVCCTIAMTAEGHYYIQKVELLSPTEYPDEVLLTIDRTTDMSGTTPSPSGPTPRLTFDNDGPWCKIMNINDGSVSDVVSCDAHITRPWATVDDPSTVTCQDNCDGSTATCVIVKNDVTYTIPDISYSDSTGCSSPTVGSFFVNITIGDTVYISFLSSMVGIKFHSATSYDKYTIERAGDTNVWSVLKPSTTGSINLPQVSGIYSAVNIIQVSPGMCFGYLFYKYDIVSDPDTLTETFTLSDGPFWEGGYIDDVNLLGFHWGLMYSNQIEIYDFNTETSKTFEPNLCDVVRVDCPSVPCDEQGLACQHNELAKCVNDYCGGCNARWICGGDDITTYCDFGENTDSCWTSAPTQRPVTFAPTEIVASAPTEIVTETKTTEDGECVVSDIAWEVVDTVCNFCFADKQNKRDCRKVARKATNGDEINFDSEWIIDDVRDEATCMLEYCKDVNDELPDDCTLNRVRLKKGRLLKDDCACDIIECVDEVAHGNGVGNLGIFIAYGLIVA
eukprot:47626_1